MKSSRCKKTSIPPLAVRYCHYTEKYLLLRLRAEHDASSEEHEDWVPDMTLVVKAAKDGDLEAACAMFLELWRAFTSKKMPDQEIVDYFEPMLLEFVLHGMSHGLREEGEPIHELDDLESLFNIKRKPDAKNPKAAGKKPGRFMSRDLDIVRQVDERYEEIIERGQKSDTEALTEAFVFVEEDIKDTPGAIKAEQIETIYKKYKEFSDQINKEEEEPEGDGRFVVFKDDLSWRKKEFHSLKSLLARITPKSQNTN